jgi:hypothetical protein
MPHPCAPRKGGTRCSRKPRVSTEGGPGVIAPPLLFFAFAAEDRPPTIVSMQFERESHNSPFILEIGNDRRSPTTRIPPFLNVHSLLADGLENSELGLRGALILDKAVKRNPLLKFRTLISVCLFEVLIDKRVGVIGERPLYDCSLGPYGNDFRQKCDHGKKPYAANDQQNCVGSLRKSTSLAVRYFLCGTTPDCRHHRAHPFANTAKGSGTQLRVRFKP